MPGLFRPIGYVPPGVGDAVPHPDPADVEVARLGQQVVGVGVAVEDQRFAGVDDVCVGLQEPRRLVGREQPEQPRADQLLARQAVIGAGRCVGVGVGEVDDASGVVAHRLQQHVRIQHRIQRCEPALVL